MANTILAPFMFTYSRRERDERNIPTMYVRVTFPKHVIPILHVFSIVAIC